MLNLRTVSDMECFMLVVLCLPSWDLCDQVLTLILPGLNQEHRVTCAGKVGTIFLSAATPLS